MKHLIFFLLMALLACSEEQIEPQFRRSPFRLHSTITMDLKTGGSCNEGFSYCSHSMDGSSVMGETDEGDIVLSWPSDSVGTDFYFHENTGIGGYEVIAGKYTLGRTPYGYNYIVFRKKCDEEKCERYDCDCGRWTLVDNAEPL